MLRVASCLPCVATPRAAGSNENSTVDRDLPLDTQRVLAMLLAHDETPWSPLWQRYAASVQVRTRACVDVCVCVCVRVSDR